MININSGTWSAVRAHAEAEIDSARMRLEAQGLPPSETEFERGRIAGLRSVLRLSEPAPQVGSWPSSD